MSNSIIQQVEDFFSEKEQWDSFLELLKNKDYIRNSWFQKFKEEMNNIFTVKDIVEKWGFISWGIWDFRWFIKDYGEDSLCLWYHTNSLHLWADQRLFDKNVLFKKLQEQKYSSIIATFDRQDEVFPPDNDYRLVERGNFSFGDINDGHIEIDDLAWYANYKTSEFVQQLSDKVNKFRKDKLITDLLNELNEISKKE